MPSRTQPGPTTRTTAWLLCSMQPVTQPSSYLLPLQLLGQFPLGSRVIHLHVLRQPFYHCEDSGEGSVRRYHPGAAPSPATVPQDSGNAWQSSGTREALGGQPLQVPAPAPSLPAHPPTL